MELNRKEVNDTISNDNFKNIFNAVGGISLGSLTATQISNLDTNELKYGVTVYDETNDVLKVLVKDSGVKTFKTITVS